jgi:plasmid stabilization system protein ParE
LKPIIFRLSAFADLKAIASYFDAIHPDITVRVVTAIRDSIERLRDFPLSGEAIRGTDLRRILSKRYRFIISYFVAPTRIEIVGVFRFQNRRA